MSAVIEPSGTVGDVDTLEAVRPRPLVDLAAVDAAVLARLDPGPVAGRVLGSDTKLRDGTLEDGVLIFLSQASPNRAPRLVYCLAEHMSALDRVLDDSSATSGLVCVCYPDRTRRWGQLPTLGSSVVLWDAHSIVSQAADLLGSAAITDNVAIFAGNSLFETLRACCCPRVSSFADDLRTGFAVIHRSVGAPPDELVVRDCLAGDTVCFARLAEDLAPVEQPVYQALRLADCPVDQAADSARLLSS